MTVVPPRPAPSRRSRRWLAGLAVLVTLAGTGLVLGTCGRDKPVAEPLPDLTATPEPIATAQWKSGPVSVPDTGALVGAWVRPESLTDDGRIAAVRAFEGVLGRKLSIINTYRQLDDPLIRPSDRTFAEAGATMMISWATGDTRSMNSGRYDAEIGAGADAVKAFGRPVLLRVRWEMDRPNLQASMWSPADYIETWHRVRSIFAARGATNVSWVWCPTIDGFAGGYAQPFYPGDDSVDWICADVYAGNRFRSMGDLLRPLLTWSASHPKPIMLGEFGVAKAWGDGRAAWLADAARVIEANPQIKAVCYFESDPDGNGLNTSYTLTGDRPALSALSRWANSQYFQPLE